MGLPKAEVADAGGRRWWLRRSGLIVGIELFVASFVWQYLSPADGAVADLAALAAALLLNGPAFAQACRGTWRGKGLGMYHLVAIAALASLADGSYRQAAAIGLLIQLAEFLDAGTARGAWESMAKLVKSVPQVALRLGSGGLEESVPTAALAVGDLIRVLPGQTIPVDGRVVSGASSVSQAMVTGEALPVERAVGDELFAGSQNLSGSLDIEVTALGGQTALGRIQELIGEAKSADNRVQRIVERYAGHYCMVVLVLAALVWLATGELSRTIAFLVIAFPDVLLMATPAVLVAAVTCLARYGVVVQRVREFEALAHARVVVLDKTGTLTTGNLSVQKLWPAEGVTPGELVAAALTAEQHSAHPFARAIVSLAERTRVQALPAERCEELHGFGVRAWQDGDCLRVGRAQWLLSEQVRHAGPPREFSEMVGMSLVGVARNEVLLGWIGAADQIRPEATAAVAWAGEQVGGRVHLVTGDLQAVGKEVGAEVGIEQVHGDCLPADKVAILQDLQAMHGPALFVGDGVNDAPSLRAADCGIAMGQGGSDLAASCAGMVLLREDLRMVPFAIDLSRFSERLVRQNLIFALLWVAVGSAFALSGWLPPVWAAASHIVDPIVILLNSGRLLKKEIEESQPRAGAAKRGGEVGSRQQMQEKSV